MSTKEASSHRKLALKRTDGEPLTRQDLQYDVLCGIFEDQHAIFTDPFSDARSGKVTFRDLYVNALINSPRSSKVLRDKMNDVPEFGTDFAKISLLANVGRINTTMAFFPEMRTTLRTYHPVPALQKTDGNLQDAPRIKNTLKACLLQSESKGAPTTPSDVLERAHSGPAPSTSVVNLIFVMANHSGAVGRSHFEGGLEFVDLFLPVDVSCKARARGFLWLCFHYLESPTGPNPFDDEYSEEHAGKAPLLPRISEEERNLENVDTPDEIAWGEKMVEQRKTFLKKYTEISAAGLPADKEDDGSTPGPSEQGAQEVPQRVKTNEGRGRGRGRGRGGARRGTPVESAARGRQSKDMLRHKTSHQLLLADGTLQASAGEPYPRLSTIQPAPVAPPPKSRAPRARKPKPAREVRRAQSYEVVYAPPSPERTMLQHAWHVITTTDPLVDSDEELADEHVRLDYMRRLKTLVRLRGKSPTPEPGQPPLPPMEW